MIYLLITTYFFVFILMTFAWALYLYLKNPGIIDVFWSIAITLAGITFLLSKNLNVITISFIALLLIWCVRLSGYLLLTRIIPGHIEKRYVNLSKDWKMSKAVAFFFNYQFQGFLAIIIATPFLWIRNLTTLEINTIIAIFLIVIGIIGESISDLQLQQFKKSHPGGVCNIGLWQYSRHPNYFFEFIVWLGFGIGAITTFPLSLLALISPVLLLFIMLKITGPITEAGSLESRGAAFEKYQKQTSYFFLLPKKDEINRL